MQPAMPSASAYECAAQTSHGPLAGPKCPGTQRHSSACTLRLSDVACAAHALQAAEPGFSLYVPGTQSTQLLPSAPVVPGLHLQSVSSAEPAEEFEFWGHRLQVGLPAPDHVPGSHGRQVSPPVAPVAAEYRPPAHCEHSKRSALSYSPEPQSTHDA